MGTWSHEVFGNDTACDWAASLAEGQSLDPIAQALAAVTDAPDGLLDADAAVEALAAADALARLRGRPGARNAYTEALDDWVLRTRLQPPPALLQQALQALQRIAGDDSELHELWAESGEADAWHATLADLHERLRAEPRPLGPAPDATARLVRRVQALRFELPALGDGATLQALYQQSVGGTALGDLDATRDAIARMWLPVAQLDKPAIAWDLAVRDATVLAMQGRLDEALHGLEAWRGQPAVQEPGLFEMRASGVCQSGGDAARMRTLRAEALARAPQQTMWRLDDALFEARSGSADAARALLDALGDLQADATLRPVDDLVRGILACRAGDPAALALLGPVAETYAGHCVTGAAAWSLGSAVLGWWALALAQAGRRDEARAVVDTLRPVLLQMHNALLVDTLRDAGLLPADAGAPARPPRVAFDGPPCTDHGAFRSVALRGVNALAWVDAQRRRHAAGGAPWPFLIGDDDDLQALLGAIDPPADGGRATLEAAAALDAAAWLKAHGPRRKPGWPRQGAGPQRAPRALFDTLSQRLRPVLHVGLADGVGPAELFARLGWGGWNACPAPEVHVALHRHWQASFGAELVALSGDTVECTVARAPAERDAALALARDHAGYCPDLVDQGAGTAGRLASTLLAAPLWSFWWD